MAWMFERAAIARASFKKYLSNPSAQTYYPDEARKSDLRIYLDQVRWFIKHGHLNNWYYFFGLDRKTAATLNNYLPDKAFHKWRDDYNASGKVGNYKANYSCLLRDKFVFGQYIRSLGFTTPRVLALCDAESIQWIDNRQTQPLERLVEHEGLDCFVKDMLGEVGRAIFPLRVAGAKIYIKDSPCDMTALKAMIRGKSILQERIRQHNDLDRLYQGSINTVRVITVQNNKNIVPLGVILRVGSGGGYCDNWGAGGIAVGVDMATGRLGRYGMFVPKFGKKVERHPQSGIMFEGFNVPYFFDALRLATDLHGFFYGVHSIGWDIAITEQGPVCIEGNENWGMPAMQVFDSEFLNKYFATIKK